LICEGKLGKSLGTAKQKALHTADLQTTQRMSEFMKQCRYIIKTDQRRVSEVGFAKLYTFTITGFVLNRLTTSSKRLHFCCPRKKSK
jgi:hypothetical protein